MSKKIPHTPFSTRLSGSAKETELRIRSIFQWKKKRPPVAVFVTCLLVCILCCSLVGFIPANETAAKQMVMNLIENREIVPETYSRLLDDESHQMVETYNNLTQELQECYTAYATMVADSYSEDALYTLHMKHIWGGHKLRYHYFIHRVSELALYPDAYFRLRNDPYIDVFLNREIGSSGGVWAQLIHRDSSVGAETEQMVQEYFSLIDTLTARLSAV